MEGTVDLLRHHLRAARYRDRPDDLVPDLGGDQSDRQMGVEYPRGLDRQRNCLSDYVPDHLSLCQKAEGKGTAGILEDLR